jgi:hypothetical protein
VLVQENEMRTMKDNLVGQRANQTIEDLYGTRLVPRLRNEKE